MTNKLLEFRVRFETFLNGEAKVRDLLKATIPLWLCLAIGTVSGIGALSWQAADREASRNASRMYSCQLRNSAQEAARLDNLGIINVIEANVADAVIIAALVNSQTTPARIDADCNADGFLTTADYLPDVFPPDLPIKKEAP